MANSKCYYYFVEGQNEKKMIEILKTSFKYIVAGRVEVFNVIQEKLTKLRIMSLKPNTTVILVFDTDVMKTSTLLENIAFLNKEPNVKEVFCITQVKNLEDELIRSCKIRQIKELTGSKTNREFKRDMIKDNNFETKLKKFEFDFEVFWNSEDENFNIVKNDSSKIKKKSL